nr:hypothetical protein [uncultured Oscillibacter sp.]
MPTYYPINETTARRAKEMNSFSDYTPGSATAAYRQEVDKAAAIAEAQKARVDPMYHEKIDRLLDTYARKLAENINQSYAIGARCPSILTAGSSNFPVRKKEKQKRDFAVRSGLLPSSALFTQEQLTEVYRSIHETLDSEYPLTDERQKLLESAAEQIEDFVPDLDERVQRSNQAELDAPRGGGMELS